ncbi:BatD family protein [Pseudofulvibacter geojedonensis]|uniref:BatD family protein n=1 Tax=Pseudofulvibacter geojedonensis TaxID=1123758 RepID=A0ABW3I088_9FLAO
MKLKNSIAILFLLAVQLVAAQVEFTAKVSKKKLGVNERLRVDFVMNEEGDNFNPPSFTGFRVVGGPSQSVSHSWVNGKRSFSKTYTYMLSPTKRGKFTIKQASIEINGETYKTIPVKIEVTSAVSKPKDANNPDYIASENIHLVAEVSKANPYLNEAISIEYRLYASPSVNISNFNIIDVPKFTDFWTQDIRVGQYKVARGTYKGQDYNYVLIRKTVLYPQKTGKLTLEPLTIDVSVDVPTNRRDFFGGRVYQTVHQKVAAGKRVINVKELPVAGKPAGFTGAVGEFEFDVTTNKKALKAGESLQATVKVSGNGNLKLFNLPELTVPSSLEVYEPEHKEQVKTSLAGMSGNISDTYTIVPQYKGNYPISKLSFSFFNPKTEKYQTLNSIEHVVEVLTGPTNTNSVTNTTNNNVVKQNVITNNTSFRSFHTTASFSAIKSSHFFKSTLFWTLLLAPLIVIPVVVLIAKKKNQIANDVQGNKVRKADKLAKKYLSDAKKNLHSKDLFYESLHKSLHNYLKAKLGIETSEFSKDKIKNIFALNKVEDQTTNSFIELIENCELARFTPISSDAMQQDYEKAALVISAIDKVL